MRRRAPWRVSSAQWWCSAIKLDRKIAYDVELVNQVLIAQILIPPILH